jgi:murein DD-endopeptidase MepM/ murein hydrolase activator NlpD
MAHGCRSATVQTCGAPLRLCAIALALALAACAAEPDAPARQRGVDIPLAPDTRTVRGELPARSTLGSFMRAQLGDDGIAQRVVAAAARVLDLRRLRAGQPFTLVRSLDGRIREFLYEIDGDRLLKISGRPDGALDARIVPIEKAREDATLSAAIDRESPSLFAALDAASEQPELAIAMAEIFAGEIDFNNDLQPGDRFTLAFEKFTRDGETAGYGPIAAAEFHNDGRTLRAFLFTPPDGKPGYYDEKGRSLKRFFLRSPLRFEPRITSGFSQARFHPVLHTTRAHLGVDYGAPIGAPVVAVSSGVVLSTTTDGANGRMVRIRHARGYETYYLHLSAFAPGVHAGTRVEQGQLIGRVGMSGLASGPHLDFRIRKNGVFVNPVRERRHLPPGEPIAPALMPAFAAERDRLAARLATAISPAPPRSAAVAAAGDQN